MHKLAHATQRAESAMPTPFLVADASGAFRIAPNIRPHPTNGAKASYFWPSLDLAPLDFLPVGLDWRHAAARIPVGAVTSTFLIPPRTTAPWPVALLPPSIVLSI